MAERHILAIGGLGDEEAAERLERFLLELTGAANPRVCYLPTAVGDDARSTVWFYQRFSPRRCRPAHLELFDRTAVDPEAFLLEQDAIFVSGGNTANLLAVWRVHGVDRAVRQAWERGVVLGGWSAGSICWFEEGVTDSFGRHELRPLDCLGLLGGSNCPHYDGEPLRRPTYTRLVAGGRLAGGLAADDGAALHFAGADLAEVVAARAGARAYRVEPDGAGSATETPLDARRLGA